MSCPDKTKSRRDACLRLPTAGRGRQADAILCLGELRNERNGPKQNSVDSVKILPDSCAAGGESSWERGEGIYVEETR